MNYDSLARVRLELSQFEEANRCLKQADTILHGLPGDHALERAEIQGNRAVLVKNWKGDLAEADRLATAAAATFREHGRRVSLATQLNDLAVIKMEREKYDDAISVYEEALTIERAEHGEEHPATARVLENMGNVYYTTGDLPKTLALLQQVLTIREKIFGADSFPAARTRFNMGAVALKNTDYRRALDMTDAAISVFRKNCRRPEHRSCRGPQTARQLPHRTRRFGRSDERLQGVAGDLRRDRCPHGDRTTDDASLHRQAAMPTARSGWCCGHRRPRDARAGPGQLRPRRMDQEVRRRAARCGP
jgi:tetratricopeptide (TPR) repeat protein